MSDVQLRVKVTDAAQSAAEVRKVRGEVDGLTAAAKRLNQTGGTGRLQKELGGIGRTATAVALGMGGLSIAVTASRQAIEGTVDAASKLNESMSKSNVVFRESAGAIEKWSKTSAEGFGLSQRQALEAAATFGNLFSAMKIGLPEASRLSKSLVELAADLASFNNLNVDDVLVNLRSGLVGEVEPLRRFGVAINAATVEAKAMELGLGGVGGALSESAKVQARYALILEQTANAQGDFARTSDGLANKQRIAAAQMANAGAQLGNLLLPAVTVGATLTATFAEQTGTLAAALEGLAPSADVFKSLALGVVAFGAAIAAVKIAAFTTALLQGAVAAAGYVKAFGLIASAGLVINPVGAALVALGAAVVVADLAARKFTGSGLIAHLTGAAAANRRAADAVRELGDAQDRLNKLVQAGVAPVDAERRAFDELTNQAVIAASRLAAARAEIARLRGTNLGSGAFTKPASELQSAQALIDVALKQIREGVEKGQIDFKELSAIIERVPTLGPALADDLKALESAATGAAEAMDDVATAIKTAKDAQSDFSGAVNDLTALFDRLDPATESLKLQQRELQLLKTRMGDAFGDANQAKLDEITRKIELLTGRAEVADLRLTAAAANIAAAFGSDIAGATEKTNELTAALLRVPKENQIDVILNLPDLEINRLLNFFTLLAQFQRDGFAIDVALRLATKIAAAPVPVIAPRDFLGGIGSGDLPGLERQNEQALAQAQLDAAFNAVKTGVDTVVGGLGPLGSTASGAAKEVLTLEKAIDDLRITAEEAETLGLSAAQAALLELAAEGEHLSEEAFRAQVDLHKLAEVMGRSGLTGEAFQLQLALEAIAENMRETQRSAEQFRLDEEVVPAIGRIQAAFDALFNRPTKESAQLDVRRLELERRKALILSSGAAKDDPRVKAIDRELSGLNSLIQLRQTELDLIQAKNIVADRSLISDRDLVTQAGLLTAAKEAETEVAKTLTSIAGQQAFAMAALTKAAQDATVALGGIPTIPARASGGPTSGLTLVGEQGPELFNAGRGGFVFNASETQRLLGAGTPAPNYTTQIYVTANTKNDAEEIARVVAERLTRQQRQSDRRGAFVTTGGGFP